MGIMETSPRPGSITLTIDQPFFLEAEQRAIGIALNWPKTWPAFAKLKPDDFFDATNALIWAAISKLRAAKLPADVAAVFSEIAPHFGGDGDPRALKIYAYMTNCVLSVVVVDGYKDTALHLLDMGAKRRMARDILDTGHRLSTSGASDSAAKIAADHIRKIQLNQGTAEAMLDAGDIIQEILDTRFDPIHVSPTGWPRFDRAMLGGFHRNKYYVIGGRMKGFKTTTLISLAYNMLVRDDPVAIDYYCLESTARQVFQKLLARWVSEVWCKENEPRGYLMTDAEFMNRWVLDQKWFGEAMQQALRYFRDRGLRFIPRAGMDLNDLTSAITASGIEGRVQGSIVDYAQLIRSPLADKGMMTEHLDRTHQTLANLAVDTPQWIVGAVQLNQTGGVRGGEGANQAASMVWHIHKVWLNKKWPGEPKKFGAWFEMKNTRYTPEGNIGDDGEEEDTPDGPVQHAEPAYWLDGDVGPCLRERPAPEVLDSDLRELRR